MALKLPSFEWNVAGKSGASKREYLHEVGHEVLHEIQRLMYKHTGGGRSRKTVSATAGG